jgi:hypothetical protein
MLPRLDVANPLASGPAGDLLTMNDQSETNAERPPFDPTAYPADTCFYERRTGPDRREAWDGRADPAPAAFPAPARRSKPERRRRVDPTTFDKQYAVEELEFMNAMQRFKVQACKPFPTYGEVLTVALEMGYRKQGGPSAC